MVLLSLMDRLYSADKHHTVFFFAEKPFIWYYIWLCRMGKCYTALCFSGLQTDKGNFPFERVVEQETDQSVLNYTQTVYACVHGFEDGVSKC